MKVIVFKDGIEIDRGIFTGGSMGKVKHVSLCESCQAEHILKPRKYDAGDGVSFQLWQEDHLSFDSNEGIDRTIYYNLPKWVFNNDPIPNHRTFINDEGDEEETYIGSLH